MVHFAPVTVFVADDNDHPYNVAEGLEPAERAIHGEAIPNRYTLPQFNDYIKFQNRILSNTGKDSVFISIRRCLENIKIYTYFSKMRLSEVV